MAAAGLISAASGVATLSLTTLPAGADSLTAVYGGDTNFLGSTSSPVSFTVVPITLTPASETLTAGAVGSSYSQAFTASGGTAPYTYTMTITSGSLPAGLTMSGGVITGTPTAIGTFAFTVQVTDSSASPGPYTSTIFSYSLTINPGTPVITWATPSAITYGTLLSSTQLNASTGGVAGTFVYSPLAGTTPAAGTDTLSVAFTPSDLADYNTPAPGSVQLIVVAPPVLAMAFAPNQIALNGASTLTFQITNPAANTVTLAANGVCTLPVVFSPAAVGVRSGTVTVSDSNGTHVITLTGTGTASGASLSPSNLSFGSVTVGTSSQLTANVNLDASSSGDLQVTGVSGSGDFSVVSGCTAPVSPGSSCGLSVTFTPAAAGVRTGTAVIAYTVGSGSGQIILALSGSGTVPGVTLLPPSLAFGTQIVGTTSPAQTVTVSNSGSSTLTINSVTAAGDFAQSSACSSLDPNGTCTITVTFTPTATGTRNGTITLIDSAGTHLVALTGTGNASGGVGLTPSTLTFGSQMVSSTSAGQSVTVNNTGTASLTVNNVIAAGDFAQTNNCAALAAGASCSMQVTFMPAATGTRNGTITLADNAGIYVVALTGMGTEAHLEFSSVALTYSAIDETVTSAVQMETVTNIGTANLTISTVSVGGTNASDFAKIADTCTGATVTPNSTCTVSMTFTPAAPGARSGTLIFTDNNNDVAGSTQTVTLSGEGADFAVSSPTGTQTVAQGGHGQYTINIPSSAGTFSGAVTLTCSNLPAQTTCAFSPNPVTPGPDGVTTQLTITTTAPNSALTIPPFTGLPPAALPAIFLAMMLTALVGWWRVRRESRRWVVAPCLLFGALLATTFMAGCGGGGYPLAKIGGTPSGTYTITVTGTSGTMQHTTTVTLTVTAY